MQNESLTSEEREMLSSGMIEVDCQKETDAVPGSDSAELNDVRDQLDAIRSFHEELARRFEDTLSSGLQQLVDLKLHDVAAMTYSQFAFSRQKPTCFVVLEATPLPAPLAIDLSPPILYPMLDCLLGGGKQACSIPDRPPTELEQRLAVRITKLLLNELRDCWETLLAVQLTVDRIESNAQKVRLVSPSDPVFVLSFQTRVADQTGDITLCLPARAIRKMVDKLVGGEYAGAEPTISSKTPFTKSVVLTARIPTRPMSSAEWSELKVGDVIMTELSADGMVDVLVDGELRFQGRPGAVNQHRAVEIKERVT